jgi:alanine dehydrogenase
MFPSIKAAARKLRSRPRTTYVVDGVVHYCVANMPGAVPRTSTFAPTIALADKGISRALEEDAGLRSGHQLRIDYRMLAHIAT